MKTEVKLALVLGLAAVGGCSDSVDPTTFGAVPIAPLDDNMSAQVLSNLNRGEMSVAQLVLPRLVSSEARSLAQRMIDEHARLEGELQAVVQDQTLAPLHTDVSVAVADDAAQVGTMLFTLPEADAAYMNSQVAMHRQALVLVDCSMGPALQNAALRDYVQNRMRPALVQHLEVATGAVAPGVAGGSTDVQPALADGNAAGAAVPSAKAMTVSCESVCDPASTAGLSVEVRDVACH
jgi:putative membrane protein